MKTFFLSLFVGGFFFLLLMFALNLNPFFCFAGASLVQFLVTRDGVQQEDAKQILKALGEREVKRVFGWRVR